MSDTLLGTLRNDKGEALATLHRRDDKWWVYSVLSKCITDQGTVGDARWHQLRAEYVD